MKYLLFFFSLFIFNTQLFAYEVRFDGDYLADQGISAILLHRQNGEVLKYHLISKKDYRKGLTLYLEEEIEENAIGISLMYGNVGSTLFPKEIVEIYPNLALRPTSAKVRSHYPQKDVSGLNIFSFLEGTYKLRSHTIVDIHEVNL